MGAGKGMGDQGSPLRRYTAQGTGYFGVDITDPPANLSFLKWC